MEGGNARGAYSFCKLLPKGRKGKEDTVRHRRARLAVETRRRGLEEARIKMHDVLSPFSGKLASAILLDPLPTATLSSSCCLFLRTPTHESRIVRARKATGLKREARWKDLVPPRTVSVPFPFILSSNLHSSRLPFSSYAFAFALNIDICMVGRRKSRWRRLF